MSAIEIKQTGDFSKTFKWLEKAKAKAGVESILDHYGRLGVDALSAATPVDTGKTASMWRYEIQNDSSGATISFHNDNVNDYVHIALILQYGHGTGTGGWVEGRDYINPALQPLFSELADEAWKEVTRV